MQTVMKLLGTTLKKELIRYHKHRWKDSVLLKATGLGLPNSEADRVPEGIAVVSTSRANGWRIQLQADTVKNKKTCGTNTLHRSSGGLVPDNLLPHTQIFDVLANLDNGACNVRAQDIWVRDRHSW